MRQGRRLFFRLCDRLTNIRLPQDLASMRLFSRLALNALTQIRQKTMHHRLISCGMGFRMEVLEYEQTPRSVSGAARSGGLSARPARW